MNVKSLISVESASTHKDSPGKEKGLFVSEFYYDTIQGEGINAGVPATFLRLQGCPLNCNYCDTKEVWKKGSFYSFEELINMLIGSPSALSQLMEGQHLVITGGSPLSQQKAIVTFLAMWYKEFGFHPYVEIENECFFIPQDALIDLVDCWNNSPKLENSGVPAKLRYRSLAIGAVANLPESWFKFVITDPVKDWKEIQNNFLDVGFFTKERIILMPEGATRKEIEEKREMVVNLAIAQGVRYSTREHIILWDKKVGC